jgi:hypothetical protein
LAFPYPSEADNRLATLLTHNKHSVIEARRGVPIFTAFAWGAVRQTRAFALSCVHLLQNICMVWLPPSRPHACEPMMPYHK